MRVKRASGGRRAASGPSPHPPAKTEGPRSLTPSTIVSLACRLPGPCQPKRPIFLKLFFFRVPARAAVADARITATANPPSPDRRTKLRPDSWRPISTTSDNLLKRNQKCLSKIWPRRPKTLRTFPVEFEFDTTLVRAIAKEGQAWFVAKDVCDIVGIADSSMALSRLDEDEKGTSNIGTLGGPQTMLAVNESGLYALIFTSRKPEAKRFRKWVTNEVLPAIGRPGDTWAIPRTTPIRSSSGRSSSASDLPTSSPRGSTSAI
jgi:hypothetical protein